MGSVHAGALIESISSIEVNKYTQELKQSSANPKSDEVTERTEELVQNQQLEQAHSHLSDTLENLKQTQSQLVQVEEDV
jgi:C4-dicarboxylate-specific signal transduction histidine kinase